MTLHANHGGLVVPQRLSSEASSGSPGEVQVCTSRMIFGHRGGRLGATSDGRASGGLVSFAPVAGSDEQNQHAHDRRQPRAKMNLAQRRMVEQEAGL